MKRKSRENTSPDLTVSIFFDDQPRFDSEPLGFIFCIFLGLPFYGLAALLNKLSGL